MIKEKGMWVSICAILAGEVRADIMQERLGTWSYLWRIWPYLVAVSLLGLKTKQQKVPCAGPNQTFLQGGFGLEATC